MAPISGWSDVRDAKHKSIAAWFDGIVSWIFEVKLHSILPIIRVTATVEVVMESEEEKGKQDTKNVK